MSDNPCEADRERRRRAINDSASRLQGAMTCLSTGEGRVAQVGRLYALVEDLIERGYPHISIIGYSFGAISTLDAVFPVGTVPPRGMRRIKTIVTVGLPAKSISTLWPEYWKSRYVDDGLANVRWINISSPLDVLSSDFSVGESAGRSPRPSPPWKITPSDSSPAAAPPKPEDETYNSGPPTHGLKPWQILLLAGLRAHANYWPREFDGDRGAVAMFGKQLVPIQDQSEEENH